MRDRKSRFIRAFTVFVSGQKEKCYKPLGGEYFRFIFIAHMV